MSCFYNDGLQIEIEQKLIFNIAIFKLEFQIEYKNIKFVDKFNNYKL